MSVPASVGVVVVDDVVEILEGVDESVDMAAEVERLGSEIWRWG